MKTYRLVNCWPHLQPHNFEGRPYDVDCPEDGEVFVKAAEAEARITALQRQLAERDAQISKLAALLVEGREIMSEYDKEIANLRARLELADALINKERGSTPEGRVVRSLAEDGTLQYDQVTRKPLSEGR